ncbi:alpha/beta fold hydrolase [Streptomyces sp. NPDC055681]
MDAGPYAFVRVDALTQKVREGGRIINVHGSGPGATGWSNFSGNIEALAEHFHVYAVDMPGWGESDAATVDQLDHVEAAIQFMDALDIDKAAFVGNSMGGQISIRLATEHPERISHLVTMGPPVGMVPTLFGAGDGPSEGLKVLIEAYRDASSEKMRRLVEIMVFDKARFATPELYQARSDAALARPEHLRNYVEGMPKGAPLPKWVKPELLPTIQVPPRSTAATTASSPTRTRCSCWRGSQTAAWWCSTTAATGR